MSGPPSANRVYLNDAVLERAPFPQEGRRAIYWDTEVPSLGVRISSTGYIAFIFFKLTWPFMLVRMGPLRAKWPWAPCVGEQSPMA